MGLHGTNARGFSEEAAVIDRDSLKSGWLHTGLVVSGYAFLRTDVRPRVGIHYQRRMATTCMLAELQSTMMQRDFLLQSVTTATQLLLLSVLPDASDRGLLI